MVIVIVIIAILGAMTVPRLLGNQKRAFQLAVDQTGDLLTMFANRESMGQKSVGLVYDHDRRALVLLSIDIDDTNANSVADWRPDPFVKPVKFPQWLTVADLIADGESVIDSPWPVASTPGQGRPTIQVILAGPDGLGASLTLDAHSLSPIVHGGQDPSPLVHQRVDLDAMGRTREDW